MKVLFWYDCPQCRGPIFIPPRPDEKVQAAVTWLQLAQGDQPSDTSTMPADVFDIYFWMSSR